MDRTDEDRAADTAIRWRQTRGRHNRLIGGRHLVRIVPAHGADPARHIEVELPNGPTMGDMMAAVEVAANVTLGPAEGQWFLTSSRHEA